jgi:chemotaxis protein MotB
MKQKSILSILLIVLVVGQSCVSTKKYQASVDEVKRLNSTNRDLQLQNSDYKQQVSDLSANNQTLNAQFATYKETCEDNQKRLNSYRASALEEMETIHSMEQVIQDGVAEFVGHGLEVSEKNGHIYVNLEDKLLYKSGSANISPEGVKALEALSGALNKYPNLQVIVVGHTDNVKFKGDMNDNLNLSTQRANGVVRVLRDKFNVNPERLVAAGQGKYSPIADNSTEEGRAQNRRTEIIINPDLEKIWNSVQSNN